MYNEAHLVGSWAVTMTIGMLQEEANSNDKTTWSLYQSQMMSVAVSGSNAAGCSYLPFRFGPATTEQTWGKCQNHYF